jgi:hypothetical protein
MHKKIKMKKIKIGTQGLCKRSALRPDQKSISLTLRFSDKVHLEKWTVIIARFEWLKRNKLTIPDDLKLANLCVVVKDGKLDRAFYASTMPHLIKKQRYYFQILN